jgi:hypothetical protein
MKVTCAPVANTTNTTSSLLDDAALLLSFRFHPVDGGLNRACQKEKNFVPPYDKFFIAQFNITSLEDCQSSCRLADLCTGIEYLSEEGECRMWKQSIDSGYEVPGSICMMYDPEGFEPVGDGTGQGEACSGNLNSNGTETEYSTLLDNVSLYECKVHCAMKQTCSGIEYRNGDGRCRVWMLPISDSTLAEGFVCLRYRQPGFLAQDGGVNRACRGEHADDEATTRKTIVAVAGSLHDCQVHCARSSCYGISYNTSSSQCEIWTQPINGSIYASGSTCLAFEPQPSTSLLCVSLAVPWTNEPSLLEMQLKERESIFACDDSVVYSSTRMNIGDGLVVSRDLGIDLHCWRGGPFNTFQNTPIFLAFWDRITKDGEFKSNSWTVKLDPDAVFFAERLRDIVRKDHPPRSAAYLNNCQLGLHGPVEVLSRQALDIYASKHEQCWRPGQEDDYLSTCFAQLGVQKVDQWDLLAEKDCWRGGFVKDRDWYQCNSAHVAFHPFKYPASYKWCTTNAKAQGHWQWIAHATQN